MFCFGPICTDDDKEIPTYVACSEKGGITHEILKEALQHIYSFNLFDRAEATSVFFEVNNNVTTCSALIGVPYVMVSSRQFRAKRSFKRELKKANKYVIQKKR